jgi:hypothetical protein
MVVVSMSEDIDPIGDVSSRAVSSGDFVSWNSSGGRARGKIERIVTDDSIDIPDSSFTITGTPDDPAALIRVYAQSDDGWVATDTLVGHKTLDPDTYRRSQSTIEEE